MITKATTHILGGESTLYLNRSFLYISWYQFTGLHFFFRVLCRPKFEIWTIPKTWSSTLVITNRTGIFCSLFNTSTTFLAVTALIKSKKERPSILPCVSFQPWCVYVAAFFFLVYLFAYIFLFSGYDWTQRSNLLCCQLIFGHPQSQSSTALSYQSLGSKQKPHPRAGTICLRGSASPPR